MQNLFISDVRLKNYKNIDEYVENIKFSQKLYPLFNFFEISLRNKLNNFYSEKFGHNWINEDRFKNYKSLSRQITEVKSRIIHKKLIYSEADFVGDLMLGFWVELFETKYLLESRLQIEQTNKIFGISRKQIIKSYSKSLHFELNLIREARNRIFHHERIYNHDRFKNIEHLLHKYIYRLDKDKYLLQMLKDKFNINIKAPTSL